MFRVCHVFLSVHCSLVVTCWERADLGAVLYVMFYCVIVTFPCGVLGQVWCLIVSISDLYLLFYFYKKRLDISYQKQVSFLFARVKEENVRKMHLTIYFKLMLHFMRCPHHSVIFFYATQS